jgi:secreted trypsin-like serine protease
MIFLWILIFLGIIQSSNQTAYTCNSNASCGCSINSTTVNRIVNGETAEIGAWGWAVTLSINRRFLCGGSVLSSSWIITAAHCVNTVNASEIITYAGSNIRWSGNQSRVGSRVIVHPNYSTATLANDIALVKLVTPLIMTDPYVNVICIPSINSTILEAQEWPLPNTTVSVYYSLTYFYFLML